MTERDRGFRPGFRLSGFSAELTVEAGGRPDVELIDLERLYRGS